MASPIWGQKPFIFYRGVANAASGMAPGLPGGAVAQGSTISIYGANLGPTASPALAFPLSSTLGGVSITLKQGTTSVSAYPVFVSAAQVNAIVPSNTPLGQVSLQLAYNNSLSNPAPVMIVKSNVGIFTVTGGAGPGIFQNYVSATSAPTNSLTVAAAPNQSVTVWGTGLGPVSFPDNVAPTVTSLPIQTQVFVGGISATIAYSGRSPCCAGIDEIVFQVPSNAPLGCWVPVYVKTGGAAVSNTVTMAISSNASSCSEPSNVLPGALIQGNNTARILAARIALHHDVGVANTNDTTTDVLGAYVAQENGDQFNFDPSVSLPPGGTCTSYTYFGDATQNAGLPPAFPAPVPTGRALNAGTISLGSAKASGFSTLVGGAIPTITGAQNSLVLNPGSVSVSASGGADVSSFQATATIPQPLVWTNRDQLQTVTRSQGFTVNWSGVASGNTVFISGFGVDLPTNASAAFICTAPAGSSSFTVPADVLANIPAARARLTQSRGTIYVGQWPIASPPSFSATGLNSGFFVPLELTGRTVAFQ
ncbi:MAG TPA: hypothetical protein VK752_16150 [Bryobacteraceae bacterium]|nr:hypothetical protein [Bryobacteraceae bacterium]